MSEKSNHRLSEWVDHYWKPLGTIVTVVLSAYEALAKIFGFPPPIFDRSSSFNMWVFFGGILLSLIVIHHPKTQVLIHRILFFLFPPAELPKDIPRIFRGPEPFCAADQGRLPSRQADIHECLRRIEATPFLILEGESGCGKSSLLAAALLPELKHKFRVIICGVSKDPFGRLSAAVRDVFYQPRDKQVGRAALVKAINDAYAEPQMASDGDQNRRIVLCLDQFEELFLTVPDKIRNHLAECLRQLVEQGKIRLLISIRSDFTDLLNQFCLSADPDLTVFDPKSRHLLCPFRDYQAKNVLGELLKPLHRDNPVQKQAADDFAEELVVALLRAPVDTRRSREDEKSVLPVELQTIGMMIESWGIPSIAPGTVRRLGGKIGILKAYMEHVRKYVSYKTGVPGTQVMSILGELVLLLRTECAASAGVVASRLAMSTKQVESALDALSDKYLVKKLPPEDSGIASLGSGGHRYELLHSHWEQVLSEVPDPVLQRSRNAEERLAFWLSYTRRVGEMGVPSGLMRGVFRYWLSDPVPFLEALRLRRYARSPDSKLMLRRTLWRYVSKAVIVLLLFALPYGIYVAWTLTDAYQFARVVADVQIGEVQGTNLAEDMAGEWVKALVAAGREEAVRDVAKVMDSRMLPVVAKVAKAEIAHATGKGDAGAEWAQAESLAALIAIDEGRDRGFELIADALRRTGNLKRAQEVLARRMPSSDPDEMASRKVHSLLDEVQVVEALSFVENWVIGNSRDPDGKRDMCLERIVELSLQRGYVDTAYASACLLQSDSARFRALLRVAKHFCRAKRYEEVDRSCAEVILIWNNKVNEDSHFRAARILSLLRIFSEECGDLEGCRGFDRMKKVFQESLDSGALRMTHLSRMNFTDIDSALYVAEYGARFCECRSAFNYAEHVDTFLWSMRDSRYLRGLSPRRSAVYRVALHATVLGKGEEVRGAVSLLKEPFKSLGYCGLADGLCQAGDAESALIEVREVRDEAYVSDRAVTEAIAHISMNRPSDAVKALSLCRLDWLTLSNREKVLKKFVLAKQSGSALEAVRRIDLEDTRCEALAILAGSMVEVGDSGSAARVFREALKTAETILDVNRRSMVLSDLAKAMARSKCFRLARNTANQCIDPVDRFGAYLEILANSSW